MHALEAAVPDKKKDSVPKDPRQNGTIPVKCSVIGDFPTASFLKKRSS